MVTSRSREPFVRKLAPRVAALSLALGLLAGCQAEPPRDAADFSRELANGARYARDLASRQQAAGDGLSRQEVVAAGYLERLRLGMGSPFRLMEYALRDPRLTSQTRTPLVWALMEGTREGQAFRVDAQALAPMGADARDWDVELGRMHQRLIDKLDLRTIDQLSLCARGKRSLVKTALGPTNTSSCKVTPA